MDTDGLALVNSGAVNQFAGLPGTAVTTLTPFLNAKATIEMLSGKPAAQDCIGILNPFMQASMVGGLFGTFNPRDTQSEQNLKGELGYNGGVHYASTANIPGFTLGTWTGATPVCPSTVLSSGASVMSSTGWLPSSSAVINAGDSFTVQGVYAFNQANRTSTAQLQQFVCTQTATSSTGTMVINFFPAMIASGPLQNVSAMPVASAPIYMWSQNGTAPLNTSTGYVSTVSLAFYEDAFTLAVADLEDTNGMGGAESQRIRDPRTKLTLRLTRWYDGIADQGILRGDLLYGWAQPRPGFACRVMS
jgi:hypothetical protein